MNTDLKWTEKEIRLSDVVVDPGLQIRVELNEDRISDFVEILDRLPPMRLVRVEREDILADGFHRYLACERSRKDVIKVLVASGTYKDALLVAIQSNSNGSLPLSRADKRKAVGQMLAYYPERANSWIAEEVGSSMQTVDSIRNDMEESGTIPKYEEFQKRDGKTTPRKHATPIKEKTEEELSEERDLARLSYAKPSELRTEEAEVDEIRDLKRATAPQSVARMERSVEKPVSDPAFVKKSCSFEFILTESVDLPIGMYKLCFVKEGGKLDVRVHLVDKSGMSPTNVGVSGNSDMVSAIANTIRG
jgi:hypothetical protein